MVCRATGHSPNAAWDKALVERRTAIRPCPATALWDLPLALHLRRRVNADYQIDFLGRGAAASPSPKYPAGNLGKLLPLKLLFLNAH
jgi:hypothetical protein